MVNHGEERFLLDLRSVKRGRLFFSSLKEAQTELRSVTENITNFGTAASLLPIKAQSEYLILEDRLKLFGATIQDAVEFYLKHHNIKEEKSLSEALLECASEKSASGRRARYVKKIKTIINSIKSGGNVNCSNFTSKDARDWINGTGWAATTKKYAINDARTFWNYCIKKGWASVNPFEDFIEITPEDKPPGILTVEQCRSLLREAANKPDTLGYTVLALFSGVRPEEIKRMDWASVDIKGGFCEVTANVSKTRRRRIVNLSENSKEWLSILKAESMKGPICPPWCFRRHFNKVKRSAGFRVSKNEKNESKYKDKDGMEWPQDCLRHSFASYHLAMYGSADKTATEMGHANTTMLFAHYRELVKPSDAKLFWGLIPESKEKNVDPTSQFATNQSAPGSIGAKN